MTATFVALLFAVRGDVTWYDAGELTTAAAVLGVPHPTGFPLLALLGHAFHLLPLGPIPFRVALLSAVSVAAATGLVHAIACRNGAEPWRAAIGAAFFPACFVVWLHGTLVEVYALNALWIALVLWLLLRPRPHLAAAALLTGLGLGAHVTCALVTAPAWVIVLTRERAWGRLHRLLPWGLAGALVLLYLPAAASRDPWLNWGDPSSPVRLLAHLSASGIRDSFADEMGPGASTWHALDQWSALAGGLPAAFTVALTALAGLVVRARAAWLAALLAVVADAGFSALLNPMGQADLQTGMPGALGLALGLALLAGAAARWQLPATLAVAACVLTAAAERPADRYLDDLAGPYGRFAAGEASPGGLTLVSSDHLASQLLYLQGVEGLRRDQVVLVTQHLPDSALVADRYGRAGLAPPPAFDAVPPEDQLARIQALLGAEVGQRPVHWELGDGRFDPTLAPSLLPVGLLYRLATDAEDARRAPPPMASPMRALLARTEGLGRPGFRTRRVFSDVARFRGVWHYFDGAPQLADAMFEEAATFDPSNAPALVNLGVTRAAAGRVQDAIALWERALELDPSHEKARKNLRRYRDGDPRLREKPAPGNDPAPSRSPAPASDR